MLFFKTFMSPSSLLRLPLRALRDRSTFLGLMGCLLGLIISFAPKASILWIFAMAGGGLIFLKKDFYTQQRKGTSASQQEDLSPAPPQFLKFIFQGYFSRGFLVLLSGTAAWAALSAFWSVAPLIALKQWICVVFMGLASLVMVRFAHSLSGEELKKGLDWLSIGVMLALGFLLTDMILNDYLFKYTKVLHHFYAEKKRIHCHGYVFLSFLVPSLFCGALLLKRLKVAASLLGIFILITVLTDFSAARLGFFLALGLGFMTWGGNRFGIRLLQGSVLVIPLLLPFLILEFAQVDNFRALFHTDHSSWEHRLFIFNAASEKILAHPWIGYGLDSLQAGTFAPDFKAWLSMNVKYISIMELLSTHPHNAYLQWWLDLGVVGLLCFCLILCTLLSKLRFVSDIRIRLAGLTFFAFAQSYFLVSFGLWQKWFLSALGIGIFVFVMLLKQFDGVQPWKQEQ